MDISLTTIKSSLQHIIQRYHVLLFVLFILGGLVFVVLSLNSIILSSSTSTDYTPSAATSTFDQQTIDRVNSLKSRDEAAAELNLTTGRSNPFVEN
ncbi:MAG: hypothetical protein JWM07_552 [Candidatus Saccharibacteria bacterium]|jgi:hypothetical protein|nr:hypothetical protein [Candidatus Saccharibacteria bacterium]